MCVNAGLSCKICWQSECCWWKLNWNVVKGFLYARAEAVTSFEGIQAFESLKNRLFVRNSRQCPWRHLAADRRLDSCSDPTTSVSSASGRFSERGRRLSCLPSLASWDPVAGSRRKWVRVQLEKVRSTHRQILEHSAGNVIHFVLRQIEFQQILLTLEVVFTDNGNVVSWQIWRGKVVKINFKARRVNKPRILSEGTPQNECIPMAGTFASTIRKTSSFLNDWNTAPIDKIFFGFLITITLISSSNSLIGTCFMFPDEHRRQQRKQKETSFYG